MKRTVGGGAHRGPVGAARQRRAIRIVQVLMALLGAGLLLYAGYTLGVASGYRAAKQDGPLGAARRPPLAQTLVLGALGAGALLAAVALQGPAGVRVPTPARLDELAGRAEAVAITRAEAPKEDSA